MKVAIIGAGLIGRSVALAARRADPTVEICEIDRGQPLALAGGADCIVLATPVDVIVDVIRSHADRLHAPVVIDTGSTKRAILRAAREAGLTHFVGGHPMSGAATSGPAAARADLFEGRPWFLIPGGAPPAVLDRARAFVSGLRAQPIVLDDDGAEHDRVMAAVSHLPQVVASVLAVVALTAAGDRAGWAGPGLRDTIRLASSSPDMWISILSSNADAVAPLLRRMASELAQLADELDNPHRLRTLFEQARALRATLDP